MFQSSNSNDKPYGAPRLTISLVTYNSAAVVASCLESIPADIPVRVVDNASCDDTVAIIRNTRPGAIVAVAKKNLGFGRAHNFNLRHMETEFGLVLNPDTILLPACLDELIQTADEDAQAAIIGAQHVHPDGEAYSCFGNDLLYYPQITPYPEKKAASVTAQGIICVDLIVGALMLLRRSAFQKNIYFDPKIFMYFEDGDICAQVRLRGNTVLLNPRARVIHLQDKSSPNSLQIARLKGFASQQAKIYTYRKYHPGAAEFYPYALKSLSVILRRMLKALVKNDTYNFHRYAAGCAGWAKGMRRA
jgi:GT2 family glycosyltransferase